MVAILTHLSSRLCLTVSGKKSLLWFALAIPLFLGACSGDKWNWYLVSPQTDTGLVNLKFLAGGYLYTIGMSLAALAISIPVGLLVSLPSFSKSPLVRSLNRIYVELVRSVPLLVIIMWIYYALPFLGKGVLGYHLQISMFWAGVISLALSDSAFEAEIFRSGIQSIAKGQTEAAQSIGLSRFDTMRYVILPQAIRRILPPLGNQLVYMLKMSSLVAFIGYGELTRKAEELNAQLYSPLEIYTVLALEYLVLILIISTLVRWLERHFRSGEQ